MEKLNRQLKKVSLGNGSGCTYADAVVRFPFLQNPQKIFDRQNDTCKAFLCIESNERRTISYKITNDCIVIWVDYEKDSDWNVLRGKKFLQQLLHQYRLHLLGYDPSKLAIVSFKRFWEKKTRQSSTNFLWAWKNLT